MTVVNHTSINNSMREQWKACPRKVYWGYVAGLEPKRKSLPLLIGSAYHKGIEVWRKSKGTDVPQAVKTACSQLAEELHNQEYPASGIEDETVKLAAYLNGYFEIYKGDIPWLSNWRIEERIAVGSEHGTLDAYYTDPNGLTWVIDDKTRSDLNPDVGMALPLNEQLLNYALLLQDTGHKVAGVMWREVKKTRCSRWKSEDAQAFAARIEAEYLGPTGASNYRETVVTLSDASLRTYRAYKSAQDQHMRTVLRLPVQVWPHNSQSCMAAFGNCEFLKLCAGVKGAAEQFFKPRNEDPLDGHEYQNGIWPKTATQKLSFPSGHNSGATSAS